MKNFSIDLLIAQLSNATNQKNSVGFAHQGRKPKDLNRHELMGRFYEMFQLTQKIFKSPTEWFSKGWNCIDIGLLLLGCEQLDTKLFPSHPSGKTLLDRTNPFVMSCIEEGKQFMDENNLVLIDGKTYEREVAKS